jgi:hypothetical protein
MEDKLSSGIGSMPQTWPCNCVRSLHELNKNACVGEGQGQTKAFPDFLCIWTDKDMCSSSSTFPKS